VILPLFSFSFPPGSGLLWSWAPLVFIHRSPFFFLPPFAPTRTKVIFFAPPPSNLVTCYSPFPHHLLQPARGPFPRRCSSYFVLFLLSPFDSALGEQTFLFSVFYPVLDEILTKVQPVLFFFVPTRVKNSFSPPCIVGPAPVRG